MSNLPLVDVSAQVNDQQGRPCAGAVVKMRLCSPDKYQGLIVPREVIASTDANGHCVLRVFPNALGYEGSVYDVHISFPGAGAGVCGRNTVPAPMRSIRQKVYVPNEDCNLMDIMDLSPREPLPAGSLIPDEVAGYAAQAANSAAAARSHAEAATSSLAQTGTYVAQAEAAKDAAQVAESSAATQAKRAKRLVDSVDETICNFETSVTQRVEKTAGLLTADATRCIREQEAVSLAAIEQRSGEALDEISQTASSARTEALEVVRNAEQNAVHAVEDARDGALDDLREVGGQFEEDFLALTERAEGAAKKAGCSAAGAANSAAKDKEYVEGVGDDVKQAVRDVAVDMLTPQVITEAVDRATAEAEAHAQAAADSAGQSATSATESTRQANLATKRADRAEAAQSKAEDAAQRAENAADSATDKAEAIIARMVDGMSSSWTLVQGVNEGGLLPLPEGCGYYPGHHAVRLSWDGLVCHQNRQWEEAGEKGVLSHAVRLLFPVPAESDFEVNIAAHADVPEAGTGATILEERLARVESNISSLSNVAVSYTELPQA